jgi:hypothetical protein
MPPPESTDEAGAPERSARQRLVEWANQQDGWARSIAAEVITTRREVSAETLTTVRDVYLVEKQLSAGETQEVPLLGDDGTNADAAEVLRLSRLRECDGVNALATGQEITFNPRMTVLFGENAAGKTGYVRILKFLANVRSAEKIIPDIHRPSAKAVPEAVIDFTLGKTPDDLTWHGEQGVTPFTRMTVFDSPAVALHLEDSVTYVYTPADLALFGYVHAAIGGVKALLQEEMDERRPNQNPFLTAFTRGTEIYPKIEALSGSTNLAELETLAVVTEAERTELESLKLSVEALGSSSSGSQAEMLRNRATVLRNLIVLGNSLAGFDSGAFTEALGTETSARTAQSESAAAVFAGGQLADELRPAWQRFLEAGEQYLVASGHATYPEADDACIYCQQQLDEAARILLTSYRTYASGAAAAALQAATSHVTTVQGTITSLAVESAIEALRATLPDLAEGEQVPDWVADSQLLLAEGEKVHEAVHARTKPDAADDTLILEALLPRLTVALSEAETSIRGLEGDATERTRLLTEQKARIALIEARLRLAQLLPDVRVHVANAAWADSLKTLLGRFQGLLAGLTGVSNLASEDALNRDFERVFTEECLALRAPTVTLDFPGRRGQAARRKKVSQDHSLADILSEGEQKVIAIADFLAEASLRTGSAPIIFDDPVNSLDHRRVREIAKRIAELSTEHQVIVFTHDIWLATELLAAFDDTPGECASYLICEEGGVKGLVSGDKHLRSDTVPSIGKRINAKIQEASSGDDEGRQERIDSTYDLVRTWCERVVEHVLLNKVAQRFQPNVAMQNLNDIHADRLGTAIATIYPIWEKACRYMTGHSQPMDTLGIRATVTELKQDWADLQKALTDYKGS